MGDTLPSKYLSGLPPVAGNAARHFERRVAEREGFEPPVRDANNSFRGYRLQPLGHLSDWYSAKFRAGIWLNGKGKAWFSLSSRISDTLYLTYPGTIPRCGGRERSSLRHFLNRGCTRIEKMAEREGFEPSIRLLGIYSLSRRAPSADSAISPLI